MIVTLVIIRLALGALGFWLLRRAQDRRIVLYPIRDCPLPHHPSSPAPSAPC